MCPTIKQKKAFNLVTEKHRSVSRAMIEAGYSPSTATKPKNLTETEGWKELMDEYLPNSDLAKVHKQLLHSHRLDHMIFPLGPKNEDEEMLEEERQEGGVAISYAERTRMTDSEIEEMLTELGCKVRKIVHGETARHVYFWSPNDKARDAALDKGYKLRGSYAPEKSLNVNIEAQIIPDARLEAIANELRERNKRGSIGGNGIGTDTLDRKAPDKE